MAILSLLPGIKHQHRHAFIADDSVRALTGSVNFVILPSLICMRCAGILLTVSFAP